jgi:hypothetical protein
MVFAINAPDSGPQSFEAFKIAAGVAVPVAESATESASPSATSATTFGPLLGKSVPVVAIVGSIVGSIILLVFCAALFITHRRRASQRAAHRSLGSHTEGAFHEIAEVTVGHTRMVSVSDSNRPSTPVLPTAAEIALAQEVQILRGQLQLERGRDRPPEYEKR